MISDSRHSVVANSMGHPVVTNSMGNPVARYNHGHQGIQRKQ